MRPSTALSTVAIAASFLRAASQAVPGAVPAADPDLVGTWASKSGTVVTGPDFYDPPNELLKEPKLPGSSYSFTADGHYEEALYIVLPNPTNPKCPSAVLQWQHGTYEVLTNGSVVLKPIKVDGRQIYSDSCKYENAIYTRYNQSELFKWYEVLTDARRGKKRLNLYRFDGSPMNPMYLEFSPPQMLPTTTLNKPTTATATSTATGKVGLKRDIPGIKNAEDIDTDRVWWLGVGLTVLGLFGYFCV